MDEEGGGPDDELAQRMRPREGSAQHTDSHIEKEHTNTHCCNEGLHAGTSTDCSDFNTRPIQNICEPMQTYFPSMCDGSQKLPKYTITVAGQPVVFLVHSTAANSVQKDSEFSPPPKMSQNDVCSVDSPGQNFTDPLRCEDWLRCLISSSYQIHVQTMSWEWIWSQSSGHT